ncbi:MAG: LysM peptidoglycan-binding domain-containing M23 family metallopeptidase [Spirochaetaceae bacterium]|nr:LysM peptidoglycan-binding domain-containing M23 family metallopeptidase [Spirochaetaceae bacterium]
MDSKRYFINRINGISYKLPGEQEFNISDKTEIQRASFTDDVFTPEITTEISEIEEIEQSFSSYKVVQGDNIRIIAAKVDLDAQSLISFNHLQSPQDLFEGRSLKVPPFRGSVVYIGRNETPLQMLQRYNLSESAQWIKLDTRRYYIALKSQDLNYWDHHFITPVEGEILQPYGMHENPLTHVKAFHDGMDYSGEQGSPVLTINRGRVVKLGIHHFYGKYVIISHPNGYQSFYAHLQDFSVAQGDTVEKGDQIGTMGNSGQVNSIQLHFSLFINQEKVDPQEYLY